MRWACLAIFFLDLELGETCTWGRLEPAFGGNRRKGSGWSVQPRGLAHWCWPFLKNNACCVHVWIDMRVQPTSAPPPPPPPPRQSRHLRSRCSPLELQDFLRAPGSAFTCAVSVSPEEYMKNRFTGSRLQACLVGLNSGYSSHVSLWRLWEGFYVKVDSGS